LFEKNRFLKKVFYPHIAIVVAFTAIAIFGLIYSFSADAAAPFLRYLSYFVSAYSLTLVCLRLPAAIKKVKKFSDNNQLLLRYKSDIKYRNKISLYANTSVSFIFMLFYLIMGVINKSLWFYSLATYYALLSLMRFFLLKDLRKENESDMLRQWNSYRFCGIILLIINIALAVITFFVIRYNQGFSHSFIETIAIALFTFITTTLAIINGIRYRKFNRPIISAVKFVNLAAALVSMFSLETAMLTVFGSQKDYSFKRIMTTLTGTVLGLIILIMAVFMIAKGTGEIKKTKNGG